MSAFTVVHLEAGPVPTDVLRCDHDGGRVSFRITNDRTQVWLYGTAEDLQRFADDMQRLADAARTAPLEEAS